MVGPEWLINGQRDERFRQHLSRHRGLELRTMARRVLSGQAAAGEGTRIRRLEADCDRDQLDLLWFAEAGELPEVGGRDTGGLQVLREGLPLQHQPQGPRRRRRLREALPEFRRHRARRSPGSPAMAVRADEKVRRGGLWIVPRAAARDAGPT